ncbi:hypothetical protein H257_17355 [Aphanomyces astaci]|uniref:Uncharacterized protein n=1 Tax=Aphanomyces astaci TaxID=112090 RepID=W4FGX3_APHAT|nr:hypothetical protein H257_17355 [Aphanomyces astaci]ETV66099.1 hypothetical protein H257_17355 [Aphanomyces astaci]|eukprot:XP_009844428.1 hypothetical protein H257_17355 [Aphanomyces astaci]
MREFSSLILVGTDIGYFSTYLNAVKSQVMVIGVSTPRERQCQCGATHSYVATGAASTPPKATVGSDVAYKLFDTSPMVKLDTSLLRGILASLSNVDLCAPPHVSMFVGQRAARTRSHKGEKVCGILH